MPVQLYFDAHVPSAICEELRRKGVDVLTAQEDDADELEDDDLLLRATALGRVVFTRIQGPRGDLATAGHTIRGLGVRPPIAAVDREIRAGPRNHREGN